MTKKRNSKKKQQLEGLVQSGILFIGDPLYMSGDMNKPGAEEDAAQDITNPFKNFGAFTEQNAGQDHNLLLPDSYRDNPIGRGVVLQLQQLGGRYTVKKKVDKKTGLVTAITIKLIP